MMPHSMKCPALKPRSVLTPSSSHCQASHPITQENPTPNDEDIRMKPMTLTVLVAIVHLLGGCNSKTDSQVGAGASKAGAGSNASNPGPYDSSTGSRTATPPAAPATNGPTVARSWADSPDARLLSILSAKDNEEVTIGKLAKQNASSDKAKQLADMLVKDHTEHGQEVAAAAKTANLILSDPSDVSRLLDKEKGVAVGARKDPLAELRALKGADFDRAFGEAMRQGHENLIAMVETARPSLQDAGVRELVEKTLPVLRHHLEMAKSLAETP
jgi:putative membrane protein